MMSLPRRSNIGNILPYTVHFERGGYNLSSSLLKQELRWIIGSAVQVRALQDAHTDFVPPFIKDRYLLLAIVLALILIAAVLVISVLTGSLRSASRIFFYRDKARPVKASMPLLPYSNHERYNVVLPSRQLENAVPATTAQHVEKVLMMYLALDFVCMA
ncbi:unnamed protein product [Symbiodinium microadriaticum]|nr:unnamed protein product [Symbiodinium microadriaticum]CAE7853387.1 unnamed protein product [Symbiodinium sp. KB8]